MTLIALSSIHSANGAPSPPDVQRYIAQQGWTAHLFRSPTVPVPGVVPLMYIAKGGLAPSCGLLTQTHAAPVFIEILSSSQGEAWPHCVAVNDVAAFDLNKKNYLVFEYINRDTGEGFYRQFFYVYKNAAGHYVEDKTLNDSTASSDPFPVKSAANFPPRAADGVKRAKAVSMAKLVPGMTFLDRDFLLDGSRSFAIFHDKSNAKCIFVMNAGTGPVKFGDELFSEGDKCIAVLASSKLEKNGNTYYIALFKGSSQDRIAVMSMNKDNVVAAEQNASVAAGKEAKLVDIKTAKQSLLAVLRTAGSK